MSTSPESSAQAARRADRRAGSLVTQALGDALGFLVEGEPPRICANFATAAFALTAPPSLTRGPRFRPVFGRHAARSRACAEPRRCPRLKSSVVRAAHRGAFRNRDDRRPRPRDRGRRPSAASRRVLGPVRRAASECRERRGDARGTGWSIFRRRRPAAVARRRRAGAGHASRPARESRGRPGRRRRGRRDRARGRDAR
jgi:hypothetical protein